MKNRMYNYLYAHTFGYFWLPCPICDERFGGHEWKRGNILNITNSSGRGVCPDCGGEARRRNKKNV